jgi:hypothetical protein
LYNASGGLQNTAIGYRTLYSNTTGQNNTSFGYNAGGTILTTGSYNTFIGGNTNATVNSIQKSTVIGYGASTDISNQIVLGTSSEIVYMPGNPYWYTTFDASAVKTVTSYTVYAMRPSPDASSNNTTMFVKGVSRQVQSTGAGTAGNGWYYLRIPQYAYGVYNIVWSSKIANAGTIGTGGIVATLSFCSDASVNNFSYATNSTGVPDGSASYYSPLYAYDTWNVGDSITVNGTLFYNSTSSLRNIFATIAVPVATTGPYLTINDVYNSYISVTKVG